MARPAVNRVLAAVAAAICLLASLATPAVLPAGAATSVIVPQSNRISGVDLQTYHDTTMSPNFARIAADGANIVNISVWWEVPASNSNSIVPVYGSVTITDSQLTQLAQEAEAEGLKVAVTPDFAVGSNGGWRGGYDPPDPATFFSNYTQMLDHYASIAQQLNMPMFWVGSEMDLAEKYTSQWASAISSVRQHYSGQVLYDANWTGLPNVHFYGLLDAMSISAYYPLSNQADPTLAQLLAAWHGANPSNTDWFSQVLAAAQQWGKPVYFGEAGYSYSTYAAGQPWAESYVSSDPGLQYRCYQALDETFRGQPWWGGVLWWSWDGGVYNMDGEPAESLIGTASVAYPPPPAAVRSTGTTSGRPAAVGSSPAASVGASSGLGPSGPTSTSLPYGSAPVTTPADAPDVPVKLQAAKGHAGLGPRFRSALLAAGIGLILITASGFYVLRRRRRQAGVALGSRKRATVSWTTPPARNP